MAPKQNHNHSHRHYIKSLKSEYDQKRTRSEKFADFVNERFGSVGFLIANILLFFIWVIINSGFIPSIPPFDPFPFSLLTTAVSLEAIILAILVLISQNRAAKIDDLREELELEINKIAEQEITKVIAMQKKILQKLGVDVSKDPELQHMLESIHTHDIQKKLEHQISK